VVRIFTGLLITLHTDEEDSNWSAPPTDVKDEDMEDYGDYDEQDYAAPVQNTGRTRQEPSYREQESPREAPRERERHRHRQHRS
jgi:hypothetical protein